MIVYGNMVIDDRQTHVALKMQNVVDGVPGCFFTYGEIEMLIGHLSTIVAKGKKRDKIKGQITELQEQFDDLLG